MELKKTPKADLQNKRTMFFQIGLVAALLFVIFMFGLSQSEIVFEEIEAPVYIVEEELVEITREPEDMPKPPSPKQSLQISSDILNIVDDDKKIEVDLSNVEFDDEVQMIFTGIANTEGSDGVGWTDEIFMRVENMPTFQGGDLNNFSRWVQSRLQYPRRAQENNIQGRVTVKFVVETNGNLTNIEVLQSPDKSLADEAVRVIGSSNSSDWKPGTQQGVPVRVGYILPVEFNLIN
ncbi:MAG: energy transducer TonB [Rikenellaceae bacterium]|nr:energy transducer TonB [Rikenellaceae bacterium]